MSKNNQNTRCDPAELFSARDVERAVALDVLESKPNYPTRVAKEVAINLGAATDIMDESERLFSRSLAKMETTRGAIADKTKTVGASLRDSQQKLADGMARVAKTADIPRLEQYVLLLERAAKAMAALAELEKTGHLEKLAKALR